MPAVILDEFDCAAILPREDASDAFISLKAKSLDTLPLDAVLGSSSVRRTAQALKLRPDLKPVGFRGNVETRLRKLAEGEADATFLAVAGLNRLGLADKITSIIPHDVMLPAVAQGAIGIEILKRNDDVRKIVDALNHQPSAIAVTCERAFLRELEGSCKTPLAGHATLSGNTISFHCEALTLDGRHVFSTSRQGTDATAMGIDAGREIKTTGGKLLII
jgi:hydroxymethylbilane synthase